MIRIYEIKTDLISICSVDFRCSVEPEQFQKAIEILYLNEDIIVTSQERGGKERRK